MARVGSSTGGSGSVSIATYTYNEVTNVASGVETTIASFTNSSLLNVFMQQIQVSGTNMAEYRIYINSVIVDKAYTSLTKFNEVRTYFTGDGTVPGLKLANGDLVEVKAIQSRNSTCSFNALIQTLEQR